jgi:hypothetical protein
MKDNEKVYIKWFDCDVQEDVYNKGIVGETTSGWNYNQCGWFKSDDDMFDSVKDALAKFMEKNCYEPTNDWENFGKEYGEDYGRFDTDILVDESNCQATDEEIKWWKEGKKRLWNCHIEVRLGVKTVRNFSEEEIENIELV